MNYRIGKYRILEEIGRGGMAVVYKAYDADLQRAVAIKVLPEGYANDPQFVQRFQHEAIMAARLQHPNIVIIHDIGHQGTLYYIVMQYLAGANLDQIVAHAGRLPLETAVAVTAQVADALDHAHRHGMIHRDIKPSNVMIAADGQVTLTDFGLVRAGESSGLTHVGAIVGTPAYMSPEQAQGLAIDHRTDIYSLGIVCCKMLSGIAPFERSTPYATLLAQIHEPLPLAGPLARLPRDVRNALQRATAKTPADRFQSAGAFAADLLAAAGVKRGKLFPVALPPAQPLPPGNPPGAEPISVAPTRLLDGGGEEAAAPAPRLATPLPAVESSPRQTHPPSAPAVRRRRRGPPLFVAAALLLLILSVAALWARGPLLRWTTALPTPSSRMTAADTPTAESAPATPVPTSTPAVASESGATREATPATSAPTPTIVMATQIVTRGVVVTATPEPTRSPFPTVSPAPATRPEPTLAVVDTVVPTSPPALKAGAVTLTGPADQARYSDGANNKIQLTWRGDLTLGPSDYYVVQIRYRHGNDVWTDDQWTKGASIIVPDYLVGNATADRFEWQVMAVREDPNGTLVFSGSKRKGYPLSDASPARVFLWSAPAGGGGGGRATATPID